MVENTQLFSKIFGGMIGAAIGDAMGGPVEGLDYHDMESQFGRVDSLLPYSKEPAEHAQFQNEAGSYTDDTRVNLLVSEAIIANNGHVVRGDFARVITDYYYNSNTELERAFIEEYFLKGLYGARKLIYGGQPTNGAIMGNAALGVLHPADPKAAFTDAYELSFITDGYAKESSAIAAAAIAAAMRPEAKIMEVIEEALDTAAWFRREDPLWAKTIQTHQWALFEGRPNQELVGAAIEIAQRHGELFSMRDELYEKLKVSPVGSEAGQTLAVAVAMLVAADGDFSQSVIGAVNYGRDCDSYATVAGAIAGALGGVDAIPPEWVNTVLAVNPRPNIKEVSKQITEIVVAHHQERQKTVEDVASQL